MKNDDLQIHLVNKSNEFVGIKIDENKVDIYIPQTLRLSKDKNEQCKEILKFLKTIEIGHSEELRSISSDINASKNIWPIDSFQWIIYDYIENGYYYKHEVNLSQKMNGKIYWKKVLKKTPVYSKGNYIYDKLITSNLSASNDIVARIYKICLSHSLKKIGWAFDLKLHVEVNQGVSNKEMIKIIRAELLSSFDDVKRLRYKHMIKILMTSAELDILQNRYTYGITNYYYVFEMMIDKYFKGIEGERKKQYNPSGFWRLEGGSEEVSSTMRPDTIYVRRTIDKNETYIIDAKMYQFGYTLSTMDLPSTSSMQKQITYGDYVHNFIDDTSDIYNVFILPCNKEKMKGNKNITFKNGDYLAYIGKAYVNYRCKRTPQKYDNIYTFIIDLNYLIQNYKKDDMYYIDLICSIIHEKDI